VVGLHSTQDLEVPEGSSRAREAREWCASGGSDLPRAPRRPYFTRTHGARTRVPVRASYTLQRRFTRCFGRWHTAGGAGRPHASRGPPRRHGPWSQVAHVPIPPRFPPRGAYAHFYIISRDFADIWGVLGTHRCRQSPKLGRFF